MLHHASATSCRPWRAVSRETRVVPAVSRRACTASASAETASSPPPSGRRITLKRPLGLVFGERVRGGEVFVESVVPNSNAAKEGVKGGETLIMTSCVVLKQEASAEQPGHGGTPWLDYKRTPFPCAGQTFDTVMSASASVFICLPLPHVLCHFQLRPTTSSGVSLMSFSSLARRSSRSPHVLWIGRVMHG